jgi:hypothetical protein
MLTVILGLEVTGITYVDEVWYRALELWRKGAFASWEGEARHTAWIRYGDC